MSSAGERQQATIARKLFARKPLTDDDHVGITRAYFEANPDPKFAAEIREKIGNGSYRSALKQALNHARIKRGQPMLTEREFQRLVWIMTNAVR